MLKSFIKVFNEACNLQVKCQGYLELYHSKKVSSNDDLNEYKDECVAEFIAHSLNLLEKQPENECSKEIINRYGKNEIFEPILLNYLFLIEGSDETKRDSTVNFDVCVDSTSETCLLNKLLNKSKPSNHIENLIISSFECSRYQFFGEQTKKTLWK